MQHMEQIKFTKQSLIDWHVTVGGKSAGWITKQNGLYRVTTKGDPTPFWTINYAEAKEIARRLVAL